MLYIIYNMLFFKKQDKADSVKLYLDISFFVIDKIQPFCKRYRIMHIYRS